MKEKGFPLPSTNFEDWVFCMYDENGNIQWGSYHSDYYCRVTLQMAMKWLREIRNINIEIITYWTKDKVVVYGNRIIGYNTVLKEIDTAYSSYEESCEDAIKYCLENLI